MKQPAQLHFKIVIPTKVGIRLRQIPAFAGMTLV